MYFEKKIKKEKIVKHNALQFLLKLEKMTVT